MIQIIVHIFVRVARVYASARLVVNRKDMCNSGSEHDEGAMGSTKGTFLPHGLLASCVVALAIEIVSA